MKALSGATHSNIYGAIISNIAVNNKNKQLLKLFAENRLFYSI
jgi:hypothetical protein